MGSSLDKLTMCEIWTYLSIYFWYRCFVKWALHTATGSCELQRICCKTRHGALRTTQVENSLRKSKVKVLREIVDKEGIDVQEALTSILKAKRIDRTRDQVCVDALFICLNQTCGYVDLCKEVEEIRKQPFCSENQDHEKQLLELWRKMMPNTPLEGRVTKQWGDIGFQGEDPQTDFRGMGILGLQNLLFFATKHPSAARKVFSQCQHPLYGYSYAIAGINITGMAYGLLKSGAFKNHFYNAKQGRPSVQDFHQVYCYLFYEFNAFWFEEKPESVMEFNRVKDKFEDIIKQRLMLSNTILQLRYKSEDTASLSSLTLLDNVS